MHVAQSAGKRVRVTISFDLTSDWMENLHEFFLSQWCGEFFLSQWCGAVDGNPTTF